MLIRDSGTFGCYTRSLTKEEEAALNSKKLFPKTVKVRLMVSLLIINKQNPDSLILSI